MERRGVLGGWKRLSLDRAFEISRSGNSWGLVALLLGLLAGAGELFARKPAPATTTQQAA